MSMEKTPAHVPLSALDEYNLRETLEAAQDELVKLLKDREHMEWRINKLQNDVVHLAALCRVEVEDPIRQLGLTDAVRWIFARDRSKSLGIRQIVDELQRSWSNASTYKNIYANVHTIFRRLKKSGDITLSATLPEHPGALGTIPLSKMGGDDQEQYVWSGGLPPIPPNLKEIIKK